MILCMRPECQTTAGCICNRRSTNAEITPLAVPHRPIPGGLAVAYPSDFGLANAVTGLIRDYGRDGAINRLVEMAERLAAGEDQYAWVFRRRRVDLSSVQAKANR